MPLLRLALMIQQCFAGLVSLAALGWMGMGIPAQGQQWPIPASALLSEATQAYGVGAAVDVLWNGRWYPARVLRVSGAHQWLITYDGHSSSWDEVVGVDRIRPRQSQPATPSQGSGGGSGTGILYPSTHWDQTGQNNPMWINPYSVPGY